MHGLASSGSEVKCSYENCSRIFQSFQHLKGHYTRCHQILDDSILPISCLNTEQSTINNASNNTNVAGSNELNEFSINGHDGCNVKPICNIEISFMRFISSLNAKANITQQNVQYVADNVQGFVENVAEFAVATVKRLAVEIEIPLDNALISSTLNALQSIPKEVANLDSIYKRDKWLEREGYYFAAKDYELHLREEQRYSFVSQSMRSTTVRDVCYFIPIEILLQRILENNFAQSLLRKSNCIGNYPKIVKDYMDSRACWEHPFLKAYPDAFILNMFIDAFETTNVLGSHTQVHKLEALYCTIGNIPFEYLSKTDSIFMLGLWYAADVKQYSYEKILSPFVNTLHQLESPNGVSIMVNGEQLSLRAIISLFSADNLGANSLFGFVESFNANHFCRFCNCSKDETQNYFHACHFEPRTRQQYDEAVSNSNRRDYNSSESGIKHGCIFNSLNFFHCIEQSVPDCMHDVLEGIIPFEMSLILQTLIDKKYLHLSDINEAIRSFHYSLSDINSKPPEIGLPNIKVQAAESWCLARNLPLMIGDKVPEDDEHWNLFLTLLECIELIFAPAITNGLISLLETLIEEHHEEFKRLYPTFSLLPKHHFLLHYPDFMRRYGPLCRYWCMRFEAKHRFGKEVASVVRNFKNICKTIMHRSQLRIANCLFNNTLFRPIVVMGNSDTVSLSFMEVAVSSFLRDKFNLTLFDEIEVASSCRLGHYDVKEGCILCIEVFNGLPVFGKVTYIVRINTTIYIILKALRTDSFYRHFFSFQIEQKNDLLAMDATTLKDYHPYIISTKYKAELELVSIRYKLF